MKSSLKAFSLAVFLLILSSAFARADADKLSVGPHDAPLGDVHLHYVVAGHGPLVFVTSPGWGVGSLYLQRGLAPLEKQFTMLYIDTRGSGGSTRPADSKQMSSSVMADDIDRLRIYLGLDSIYLMGHSNGGAIALDYGERYPDRVRKLILLDSEVMDDQADNATDAFLKLWYDDPRYKAAIQEVEKNPPTNTDESFGSFLEAILPLCFSDPDRYVPAFLQTFEGTHLSAYAGDAQSAAEKLAPRKQSKDYAKVRAKTLILSGTLDWVCPTEVSQRMHAGIQGSVLSIYANAGHVLWIEQPDRFFSELSHFLAN
jgi:proline iminopeptidase